MRTIVVQAKLAQLFGDFEVIATLDEQTPMQRVIDLLVPVVLETLEGWDIAPLENVREFVEVLLISDYNQTENEEVYFQCTTVELLK